MKDCFDIAIVGSGFSGSILARILAIAGNRVLLLDSDRHPRFAIGESSTPIADLLLRRLGERYGLSDLISMSSYGTWQSDIPELACGMKRGFSYFDHRSLGQGLQESFKGESSLIVAASPTDAKSDTHWYRPDVDAFLFRQAVNAGVEAVQSDAVIGLDCSADDRVQIRTAKGNLYATRRLIDASGAGHVLAKLSNSAPLVDQLSTHTAASFAHFDSVKSFSHSFNSIHNDNRATSPFDSDDAAQHHLIDEGWVWMLRMNNGVTSIGVCSAADQDDDCQTVSADVAAELFRTRFEKYPALNQVFSLSNLVAPQDGIVSVPRLQRLFDPVVSDRCLMTPTAAVAIDPLHSTGIAHAIAGIGRLAEVALGGWQGEAIDDYRRSVLDEARQIDAIVSLAYDSMRSFSRFSAACMTYFAAAIACEESIGTGDLPRRLWLADDEVFSGVLAECISVLRSAAPDDEAVRRIRELIKPFNRCGLMDDSVENRYAYTATK